MPRSKYEISWAMVAVYSVALIAIVYHVVVFIAQWLGDSSIVNVRAFGAILIVIIIGVGGFLLVRLIRLLFK